MCSKLAAVELSAAGSHFNFVIAPYQLALLEISQSLGCCYLSFRTHRLRTPFFSTANQYLVSPGIMASSSKSQANKGVEKRKREKADQDETSQKKKRRHRNEGKQEQPAGTPSKSKGDATTPANQPTCSPVKHPSYTNGEIQEAKALQRWRIAEPMGGRMSDVDPIFSADEK